MRVLLRDLQSGSYFQAVGQWTEMPDQAWDFEQVEHAKRSVSKVDRHQVEVVLSFGGGQAEVRVPAR